MGGDRVKDGDAARCASGETGEGDVQNSSCFQISELEGSWYVTLWYFRYEEIFLVRFVHLSFSSSLTKE